MDRRERQRVIALERLKNGEKATTICRSLGCTRSWLYKWVHRSQAGASDWFKDQSRRPQHTHKTSKEEEEVVAAIRLFLYNRGSCCGPQAIRWEMEAQGVSPKPSVRTIARILSRRDLTYRRTGSYEPKGKNYPAWPVQDPGDVHQADFTGPCYIKGGLRFYSLNCMDVATRRCAVLPMANRESGLVVETLWESWWKLGLPGILQVDNELSFFGSRRFPHGMGALIRLCLLHGVEPCFIPIREPWRNGVIERFNRSWVSGFFKHIQLTGWQNLVSESNRFEQLWNSAHRHSALQGLTPLKYLETRNSVLRYPPHREPPRFPLPKPKIGRYHFIRFVRSSRKLDLFGESFPMPIECTYEYVRATVDVPHQKLMVYLGNELIHSFKYPLR